MRLDALSCLFQKIVHLYDNYGNTVCFDRLDALLRDLTANCLANEERIRSLYDLLAGADSILELDNQGVYQYFG